MGIAIMNQSLQNIVQCHSDYNKVIIKNSGKRMIVSINLGKINLNPGYYSFSMGVQAEEFGEILIRHVSFANIKILGDFYGYAPIQIAGQWDINEK